MDITDTIAHAIKRADSSYFFENYTKQAEAVLRALGKDGWRIVPAKPTEAMEQAGVDAILPGKVRPHDLARHIYEAMTAAPGKGMRDKG